jgi:hypothetical protein
VIKQESHFLFQNSGAILPRLIGTLSKRATVYGGNLCAKGDKTTAKKGGNRTGRKGRKMENIILGEQSTNIPRKLKTRLVVVLHNGAQDNLKRYTRGYLRLVFEPDNPYHDKAVKVMSGRNFLGYLPREHGEIVVDAWNQERKYHKVVWARKAENSGHDTIGMRLVLEERPTGKLN